MASEPEPGVDELVFYPRPPDTVDAQRYLALRDGRFVFGQQLNVRSAADRVVILAQRQAFQAQYGLLCQNTKDFGRGLRT